MIQFSFKNCAFPLLCALLLTACSGSRLGETVGKSLEADPQLLDESGVVASNAPAEQTASNAKPKAKPAANSADGEPAAADAEKEEKEAPQAEPKVVGGEYTDLGKAPEELQEYLVDLLELELLEVRSPTPAAASSATTASANTDDSDTDDSDSDDDSASAEDSTPAPKVDIPGPNEFRPNRAVTRREYARWLLAVNNRYYSGERNRKIRPGVTSSKPVFQDVSASDPDFAAIQGLAEAGIIPSPLTGSSTTLTFRPDAPLTRKDLILWKVPLDTRQPLPQATPKAVEEAWGFQDASKIDPRPLQAVLADYQNGDFANIRRAFGYTTLFQPAKAATRAETAAVLWRIGNSTEAITAAQIRNPNSANNAEENE